MEFRLDENTLMMYVRDIERELLQEQNAFNKNENVDSIRRRHEEFFEDDLINKLNSLLENMGVMNHKHSTKVSGN